MDGAIGQGQRVGIEAQSAFHGDDRELAARLEEETEAQADWRRARELAADAEWQAWVDEGRALFLDAVELVGEAGL